MISLLERLEDFEGVIGGFIVDYNELKVVGIGGVDALYREFNTFSVIVAGNEDRKRFLVFQPSFLLSVKEKEHQHERKAEEIRVEGKVNEVHRREGG
jgi:hypothetical protein